MEPDFYQLYQDLPLPDLVKVARTPSDHLPEAVAAAEKILQERGISREQIAEEEWVIAQKEIADGLKRGRRREYTAWIGELFGGERLTPRTDRWLTILLVAYGCFYFYTIYITIRELVFLYRCTSCGPVQWIVAGILVDAAVATLCLYYLLKQRWLGWSLVMVNVVFFLCRKMALLFHLYFHHDLYFELFFAQLLSSLIYIALSILLWRPYVMSTFGINEKIRSRTMLAAALVGIATMLFL